MAESQFIYVTFIRSTPEKLWQALMEREFTREFWMGTKQRLATAPSYPTPGHPNDEDLSLGTPTLQKQLRGEGGAPARPRPLLIPVQLMQPIRREGARSSHRLPAGAVAQLPVRVF